ncbi:MAG: hydrogenase expression/formation protein HypE [Anaerolineales bacterium]|jgi:hydrogenase expression/formation protein HypE
MSEESEFIVIHGLVCPLPLAHDNTVVLGHGSGGKLMHDLIAHRFYPPLANEDLLRGDDAAVLAAPGGARLALSTDSHIVSPLFFPGGDIGRLAVCGTVNDLAVMGARPQWLTAGFILEEGLPMFLLEQVLDSMKSAAQEAGVQVVAGDTKVVERGKADGLFINTAGVGWIPEGRDVGGAHAYPGDAVLVTGNIGDHGIAVLGARGELQFEAEIESDVSPLNSLVEALFEACETVHTLRDPTRGGVATTLNEIAHQSGVTIRLDEDAIPVDPAVLAACEMLGFDPLYVANEGKLVVILPENDAETALDALRSEPYGQGACRIGTVEEGQAGRVLMRTAIGGTRVVDVLAGEMLPRIC